MLLSPPTVRPEEVDAALREQGYAVLSREGLLALTGLEADALAALQPAWDGLPPDAYLRDGGHYRFRRHACFIIDTASATVAPAPHRAHWQPVEYNALHGGIERWFEPIEPECLELPAWPGLLLGLGYRFSRLKPVARWFVEAHQFRIDTREGIGRPTPEGAHRDGVDFVAVSLIARAGVKGGETRVFEAAGPRGVRFTLDQPWSTLLLDDERVIHETTPIQPLADGGHRDTLVLTYRAGGFQGPR